MGLTFCYIVTMVISKLPELLFENRRTAPAVNQANTYPLAESSPESSTAAVIKDRHSHLLSNVNSLFLTVRGLVSSYSLVS